MILSSHTNNYISCALHRFTGGASETLCEHCHTYIHICKHSLLPFGRSLLYFYAQCACIICSCYCYYFSLFLFLPSLLSLLFCIYYSFNFFIHFVRLFISFRVILKCIFNTTINAKYLSISS